MKIKHFTLALILTTILVMPTYGANVNFGKNTTQSKDIDKPSDPLNIITFQSKMLRERLDFIRNNPATTTAKKRESLAKLSPLWRANVKNFLDVLKYKKATDEDIAYARERLARYTDEAFVCNDSGTNLCAESVPQ
jgi:hypothetical protein